MVTKSDCQIDYFQPSLLYYCIATFYYMCVLMNVCLNGYCDACSVLVWCIATFLLRLSLLACRKMQGESRCVSLTSVSTQSLLQKALGNTFLWGDTLQLRTLLTQAELPWTRRRSALQRCSMQNYSCVEISECPSTRSPAIGLLAPLHCHYYWFGKG